MKPGPFLTASLFTIVWLWSASLLGQTPSSTTSANPTMAASTVGSVQTASAPASAGAEIAAPQRHLAPMAASRAPNADPPDASLGKDAAGESEKLHLLVGRSLILDFPERMSRVYVSNPAVLDAVTATAQELIVTAKDAGSSSLVVWSKQPTPKIYIVVADVDISGLRHSLAKALPGDHIDVQADQGRIYLTGIVDSDDAAGEAERLATVYSKQVINSLVVDARHLPQVQLEVKIIELDRSKLTAFGINLFSLGQNSGSTTTQQFAPPGFQSQNGSNSAIISDFLNLFYFNLPHGLGTTIKDLQTKGVLEILAEPNLTTIHGQPARFLAGGEFPYPIVQPGGAGSVPTVTVQFRPYGVKLEFTPYVNSDGTIRLKVAPEVSALDYTNEVVIAGYALPALSTRKAETEVELRDGESFGISGILDHRTTDSLSKMPGIADIPILGQLFRSKNLNRSTMELLVIVTPRIIDTLNNPESSPPKAPEMPVPFLEAPAFDRNLPKN